MHISIYFYIHEISYNILLFMLQLQLHLHLQLHGYVVQFLLIDLITFPSVSQFDGRLYI